MAVPIRDDLERSVGLKPPALPIIDKEDFEYLHDYLESFYGSDFDLVTKLSKEIIEEAVIPLVRSSVDELRDTFLEKYPSYVAYNSILTTIGHKKGRNRVIEINEEIYEKLEEKLPPELKEPFKILYDSQIFTKRIQELGEETFFKRIKERCYEEYRDLLNYANAVAYITTACFLCHLDFECSSDVWETLNEWLDSYAKELDRYIVTVDLFVTDEYYETIKDVV